MTGVPAVGDRAPGAVSSRRPDSAQSSGANKTGPPHCSLLATELPAAILAWMVGVRIKVVVQWLQIAAEASLHFWALGHVPAAESIGSTTPLRSPVHRLR
ncbi:hypothetical protein OIE43_00570 [Streptomyces pseudovenezuelae]|uniref:hypothetical protein n=1 Tax=Streptomyces pseudovenezuelae TaxID=67350 RepID=UPI002E2EC741|nr:hypothetical protein [Streptomyces pseudovenezuelae]